jgi:hypothetical protein
MLTKSSAQRLRTHRLQRTGNEKPGKEFLTVDVLDSTQVPVAAGELNMGYFLRAEADLGTDLHPAAGQYPWLRVRLSR